MLNVGDKVTRRPVTFSPDRDELLPLKKRKEQSFHEMWNASGTVVYIHPEGKYHVVEFDLPGGKVREAFKGAK